MAELTRKKKVRAGHRASTTNILGQVDPSLAATPLDVSKITQLKRSLENKLQSLSTLDDEILALTPEEAIEDEIVQADGIRDRIYEALSRLELALKPVTTAVGRTEPLLVPTLPDPATTDPVPRPTDGSTDVVPTTDPPPRDLLADDHATDGATPLVRGAKVKLPKITLPRFSGDPVKWVSFWDSYKSAIHTNSELSEVDKFNYLRSLLDHTAFDAIAGLTLSSANYQQAVDILCKRFGNKQVIISKHMDTLMHMDPIPSDRHLRDLRRLYDHTESHVRSLKSLGIESASYGALLSPVLLTKLPPDLRLIVSRKVSDSDLDMDALLTAFEEELTARERANPQLSRRGQEKPRHSASTLFSGSQHAKTDPQCCYCQQSHPSTSCTSVTNPLDRKQSLKTSGRCFNCLRRSHVSRNCKSMSRCQKCNRKHHTSICDAGPSQSPSTVRPSEPGLNPDAPPFQTTSALCSDNLQTVFLQTACAVIHHPCDPNISLAIRLILDGGSQKSYISERARGLLNLEATEEKSLSIATFGSAKGSTKVCPIVSVGMCLRGYPSMSLTLYVMPTICEPLVGQPVSACAKQYPHLLGLELADSSNSGSRMPIDVLIGSDYYWQLVTGSVCRGANGPIAVHTKLGWVLSGPSLCNKSGRCAMNLSVTHVLHSETHSVEPCALDEQLRAFWELEALGIQDEEKTLYDDFTGAVKFENGRYKVPLPWREFRDPLPDNYQLSVNRLQGLLRRLRQDPAILREYDRIIQDQLTKGIIETVSPDESTPETTHYLPHHAVVRRDKSTTKVRVVYDASAKSANGPSLNDCLLKGPKFNQLIFDLLVRFRSYQIALTADLEKAFLMVMVEESDRNVLRFLWVDDPFKESPELKVYRFTRVVFGVSSSPFLLNATIRFHLEKYLETNENLIRKLLRSTYVDDIIAGGRAEDEVLNLYTRAKEIFREGGFNLRKFLTNAKRVQEQINLQEADGPPQQDEPTYSEATLGTSQPTGMEEHKVLGVPWNPESDQFIFDVSHLATLALDLEPTKRNLVSLIGKFYDPLGFLSPMIIRFKVLFQKLCLCKCDWDEAIPEELLEEWNRLISDLGMTLPVSLPRSYTSELDSHLKSATLCGFCDASTKAYAAVVYLVLRSETDCVTRFVAAKTRVAPLQSQTIPRLELLSAFLLSKLIVSVHNSLQHQMPPMGMCCYTDSQVALYWVQGKDKEWKPFVQNRVREIRRKVHPGLWYHCPGITNPADLPSRGLSMIELAVSQLWRTGPEWLKSSAPTHSDVDSMPMPELCSQELKSSSKRALNLLVVDNEPTIGDLIPCEEFSELQRLLRVTAYVLRAVDRFKMKTSSPTTLTSQDIAAAEVLWITQAQKALVQQKDYHTLRSQLGLFLDEKGLWRCGGRLQNAEIPYSVKHPILLPRSHPFTALIVRDAHLRVCHNGVKETLTEVRSRYWVVRSRSLTRAIVHKCTVCRKFEGTPFKSPPPPPLPEFRIKEDPAFSYTGVDFAGPLFVRNPSSDGSTKVWICVFTCLVTRAVHLDIVCDQSTGTFLRCLKRFASRRGLPHKFLSDNGRTFKAAAKFLKVVFKDEAVQDHLAARGSQWIFNVECAPWWGGVFERMVRSTKRCLRKMVGRAKFTRDEMLTAVVEIEAVINSRPLSYVSSADSEEPLTPSHLIVGRRILSLPDHLDHMCDPDDEDFEVNSSQLTKRMKHLANVLNHFWRRWRSEYLNELRESHRYVAKKTSIVPHVTKGDIVIVHDESLPRGHWKLGRITEVYSGSDGLPRSALVRVATRDRQHTLLKRPLKLLYPLEINQPEPRQEAEVAPELSVQPSESPGPVRRPIRASANRARRVWIQELVED